MILALQGLGDCQPTACHMNLRPNGEGTGASVFAFATLEVSWLGVFCACTAPCYNFRWREVRRVKSRSWVS